MGKIWVGVLIVIGLIIPSIFAKDFNDCYTNGYFNGNAIMLGEKDKTAKDISFGYISGIIDCAVNYDHDGIDSFYRNATKGEIENAVKNYYQNNPTQRQRPILEVILSGCK